MRRPGPSGPAESSPRRGSRRSAVLVSADNCSSCQRISSRTVSASFGAAKPAAFAAYAAAPSACAPMWATPAACAAARATATAAGVVTSRAARPAMKRRRISPAASSSPRANARARAMASRGRRSAGDSCSNNASTRSAQSAAQDATRRRSVSLNVCGEATPAPYASPERRDARARAASCASRSSETTRSAVIAPGFTTDTQPAAPYRGCGAKTSGSAGPTPASAIRAV